MKPDSGWSRSARASRWPRGAHWDGAGETSASAKKPSTPPGLAAAIDYQPTAMTYTNGAHVCEVEVDIGTGGVRILRYVVVHDCGRMINPLMVEGQVMGGVAHGIGATLLEWMQYDANGQPLTASFADYLLPTRDVVPTIEIHHMESPTPVNPLGVKGAAESGTIGAPSAIVSAIEDALRPLDVRVCQLPVTPARLRALILSSLRAQRSNPDGGATSSGLLRRPAGSSQ